MGRAAIKPGGLRGERSGITDANGYCQPALSAATPPVHRVVMPATTRHKQKRTHD